MGNILRQALFLNQILTFFKAHSPFPLRCSAVTAFWRQLGVVSLLYALLHSSIKRTFYSVIQMIPRQNFIKASLSISVKRRVNSALFKYLKPFIQAEKVTPAVKIIPFQKLITMPCKAFCLRVQKRLLQSWLRNRDSCNLFFSSN